MNILIIGGLIAIALLALLGAILLSMAEERAEKEQKAKAAALLPQPSKVPPRTQFPGVVVRPVDQVKAGELLPLNKEAPLNTLYTLADELHTLTQRTGDLEQRLSGLTALLERRRVSEVTTPDSDITTP